MFSSVVSYFLLTWINQKLCPALKHLSVTRALIGHIWANVYLMWMTEINFILYYPCFFISPQWWVLMLTVGVTIPVILGLWAVMYCCCGFVCASMCVCVCVHVAMGVVMNDWPHTQSAQSAGPKLLYHLRSNQPTVYSVLCASITTVGKTHPESSRLAECKIHRFVKSLCKCSVS